MLWLKFQEDKTYLKEQITKRQLEYENMFGRRKYGEKSMVEENGGKKKEGEKGEGGSRTQCFTSHKTGILVKLLD